MNDLLYPILALAAFVCWRQKKPLGKLAKKWPIIFWAVAFYLLGEIGDLTSTVVGMNYGLIEANTLMADPITQKFILTLGIAVKTLGAIFLLAVPSRFVFLATRKWNSHICSILTSGLFWWRGYELMDVTFNNLLNLFF